ncbi:MAG TPA: HAD family hydrolase [Myxococcales bacterium]|nr:HAD family hydrolase [Myxococcales bacterium]
MLQALLLDLDGTLVDTPQAIVDVMQATLTALGRAPAEPQAIRDTIGLPLPESLALLLGIGVAEAGEAVQIYRELWHKHVTPRIAHLLYPGVREGIAEWRALGLRLAVVTGKSQEGADGTVALMGMTEQIEVVLGYTSVARGKPAPDLALEALKRLGVPAGDALMIGDSELDVGMAVAAGVRTIAVTYGAQPAGRLQGATWFAHSFAEVMRIVREEARLAACPSPA